MAPIGTSEARDPEAASRQVTVRYHTGTGRLVQGKQAAEGQSDRHGKSPPCKLLQFVAVLLLCIFATWSNVRKDAAG